MTRKSIRYLRFIKGLIECRMTRISHPILATICITNKCNLDCIYCYRNQSNEREFTIDELLKLIDFLVKNGTRYISLNGGEPLLREDLGMIVDKIQKKDILCHLSTNGLLVKKNINILKRMDSIALSLDGFKNSNDINRGKSSYDKIIDAVECLKENKINFYTHTVLTKNNKNAIDEMMNLANFYKFKVQFSILRTDDLNKELALSDEEIRRSIVKILSYKEKNYPVFFSKETYLSMLKYPYSYTKLSVFGKQNEIFKTPICLLKHFACHIESDGKVYPCIVLVDKFEALNIFDVGIEKALKNLQNNKCESCYNACCTDLNYLFSFKTRVMINALKNVIRSF